MNDIREKTDTELVFLVRQDPEYLLYIIERYKEKLYKYIQRRTDASPADMDDILQDVFIKIYKNINAYNDSLLFSSWIYRITHNHTIDWYRKNKKHRGISIDDEENKLIHILEGELSDDINTQDIKDEQILLLKKALEKMPPDQREIVLLHFFEEKSYEEISDILKISVTNVGVKIHRAKKLLKKIYE